jgi:hypothetical protein
MEKEMGPAADLVAAPLMMIRTVCGVGDWTISKPHSYKIAWERN